MMVGAIEIPTNTHFHCFGIIECVLVCIKIMKLDSIDINNH